MKSFGFAIAALALLAATLVPGTEASGCYSGVCGSSVKAAGVQRFVQEEHHDVHELAVAGVWWALAGLLVAIGYATKTYFETLIASGGISSFTTLVAWVFSIWAVITALFIGIALIITFSL